MRAFHADLQDELDTGEPLLIRLVEIEKPDGTFIRLSDTGVNTFTLSSNEYGGTLGFDLSAFSFSTGETPPAVEGMSGAGLSLPMGFDAVASGILTGSAVRLWVAGVASGKSWELGSKWYVGGSKIDDAGKVTLDIKASARRNRQLYLRTFAPGCKHALGDSGCGVNLASYTDTVTVVTNADRLTLTVTGSSRANDYFANGAIRFTSGEMNGLSMDVRKWTLSGGIIRLANPLPRPLTAGDTGTIHAGCDKTTGAAGCARFANIARRFAFDHLPDETLSFPVVTTEAATAATTGGEGIWLNGSGGGSSGAWG